MIRRRSYTEAVEAGVLADDSEYLPCPRPLNQVMKRSSHISSSDDSDDGQIVYKPEPPKDRNSFIRSDSIRYYDLRNSRGSLQNLEDAASRLSVQQIYDSCLNYVSEEKVTKDDLNGEAIELRIVEDGEMIGRVNGEEVTVLPSENLDDDDTKSDGVSIFPVTYTGRNSTRKSRKRPEFFGSRAKKPKRVVFKSGQTNIPLRNNIKGRARLFLDDFATSLIELRWRWLTFYFAACNFAVWLAFAAMFYVAAHANGDFAKDRKEDHKYCINDGFTFTGIYLFSVESQVSIGYGQKYPNEECPEVIFILLMEVVVGYIMIGGMTCVVYAKIIRPEKILEGVGFSKNAVVCLRDGQLCLVFRAWDCHQKHAIGFHASAWYVRHNAGSAPSIFPLKLNAAPILMWPTTIQHTIDQKSPLFDMSAKDLLDKRFEIIFALAGADRSTGQMTQTKTSYLPHEILWGSRFKCATSYSYEEGAYVIDAESVNVVDPVDTPLCSARLLHHVNNALREPTSISLPGSPLFLSPFGSPLASPTWGRSFKEERALNASLP